VSPARGARGRAALLIAVGALVASSAVPAPALAAPAAGDAAAPIAAAEPAAPTATLAWTATPTYPTAARSAPRPGARRIARVTPTAAWDGGAVGLLVLGAREDGSGRLWVRVQLPERPNGRSGWIDADYAKLSPTPWRIVVERGKRRATAFRDGRAVRSWSVVVGKPSTPTPRGLFAVYERVRQPPGSELGPWALQLTAHSNTLMNYGGGPGRVALHGRSGPLLVDPLGSARSHGCIRMQNQVISWVAGWARPGTPVEVR
jgi:lipoprotein-anchoring transpeptidase ErfK/SrfK